MSENWRQGNAILYPICAIFRDHYYIGHILTKVTEEVGADEGEARKKDDQDFWMKHDVYE